MRKRHTSGLQRAPQRLPSGADSKYVSRRGSYGSALFAILLVCSLPGITLADAGSAERSDAREVTADAYAPSPAGFPIVVAHADGSDNVKGSRPLEPRYQALEPEPTSWYNGSYIFGMTRGLADSTIAPAAKGPLFLFTVPLDIVFLPFAVIGGMFG